MKLHEQGRRILILPKRCHCCGKPLPPGGSYFVLRVEISTGFDGCLPEPAEDPEELIRAALKELAKRTAAENEKDVFEEMLMVLCPACRLAVRKQLRDIDRFAGSEPA